MCNIAGYSGAKQAAPILVEMLRCQQCFDGEQSCGVATVHEGKLYYRKIVGNVDKFIKETDVLSLPGTIGIAHTRPSNTSYELAHPYISMSGEMAVVSNGSTPTNQYSPRRDAAIQMLADAGYEFKTGTMDPNVGWPRLKNGMAVGSGEVRVHLVDYYLKQGMNFDQALAAAASDMYTDNVFLALNQNDPDHIHVIRTVRPMQVLLAKGEVYLATTAFGFPEGMQGERVMLPIFHPCSVGLDGIHISTEKVDIEPVCPITPQIYAAAYNAVEELLTGKKDDPVYTSLVFRKVNETVTPMWPEEHTFNLRVQLTYQILEDLESQGRLRRIIGEVPYTNMLGENTFNRYFMWIE